MNCHGSVVMEDGLPDSTSRYAAEGTVAHEVAAAVLEGDDPSNWLGEIVEVDGFEIKVTSDMLNHVDSYVLYVEDQIGKYDTGMFENAVSLDHLTGEKDATGTADVIIIGTDSITVIDLKFGMGEKVEAEDNPQLQMYASGALRLVREVVGEYKPRTVRMVIHQPRLDAVSVWEIDLDALTQFEDKVQASAFAIDTIKYSGVDEGKDLRPGEKACRWCKAKAKCPALRDAVTEITSGKVATAADFAKYVPEAPDKDTGDNYLSMAMSKVSLVEDWCKAVRAEVEIRLLKGGEVDGFKLVQGKRGSRRWTQQDAVEERIKKARIKRDQVYTESLMSPTQLEKTVGKNNPKVWADLQKLITQSDGKPSVAFATDKRPALDVSNHAEDFRKLAK